MTTWDSTVDFVIVGSGGGGMVAALTAADAGASALVLEKQERIGGSTAMSGGIAWVPNNPVMAADGVRDAYEDAMAHFEAVVGDVGPCSSFERRHAFVTAGPEMVSFLQDGGVRFVYCPGYSDYYSSAKGGHDSGRGIEPVPFDGRVLGEWLPKLQPGLAKSLGLAVMTKTEALLILLGGIFVIEALSVVIQVISFQTTRKRVFLMAPIHHHFELRAWSETKIILRFWIVASICAAIGFTIYHHR